MFSSEVWDEDTAKMYHELAISFHKFGPAFLEFMLKNVILVLSNSAYIGVDYLSSRVLVGIPTEKLNYLQKMAKDLLYFEVLTDFAYKKTGYTYIYANIKESSVSDRFRYIKSLSKNNHESNSRLLGYANFKLNAVPRRPNVKSGRFSLQWEITNFHLTIEGIDISATPLI